MSAHSFHASEDSNAANFRDVVDALAYRKSGIKHVSQPSRFRSSLVSVYDYDSQWKAASDPLRAHLDFSDRTQEDLTREFITGLRNKIGESTKKRVIYIEDLCFELISPLSNIFDLSPEVCEDYLVNSGWGGRYGDTESNHWKTRRVHKEHATLKWVRPCTLTLESLGEDSLELSRNSILDQTRREVRTIELGQGRRRIRAFEHDVSAGTNIWRRHLDLRINENGKFRHDDSIGWEERTTIWRRAEENGLFVIIFLDPSPLAVAHERIPNERPTMPRERGFYQGTRIQSSGIDDLEAAIRKLATRTINSDNFNLEQPAEVPQVDGQGSQSITSQSGHAVTQPVSRPSSRVSEPEVAQMSNQTAQTSTGPTPKSDNTHIPPRSQGVPSNVSDEDEDAIKPIKNDAESEKPVGSSADQSLSLSPLSGSRMVDSTQVDLEKASASGSGLSSSKQNRKTRLRSQRKQIHIKAVFDDDEDDDDDDGSIEGKLLHSEVEADMRLGFILRNVASRGPTFDLSLVPTRFNRYSFRKAFRPTTSTLHDLELWMESEKTVTNEQQLGIGAATTVLNIISNDIEDFFQVYEDFLDNVEHQSSDQLAVQRLLPSWRSLMNHVAEELRYLERQVPEFMAFVCPDIVSPKGGLSVSDPLFDVNKTLLPNFRNQIRRLKERTERSSQALVASVSILESRRGIDEAQSVTKLTELAFFFIPISFAASFFGMQVKELDPADTSIWKFFALTAGIMFASYFLVFLRSQYFKNILSRHRDDIERFVERRDEALYLRNDGRLDLGWIVDYLWEEKFAWIASAGWLLVIVIPIIPIWTSSLIRSIKLIISITVLLCSLIVMVVLNIGTIQHWLAKVTPGYRGYGNVVDSDEED